jgi:putative hydrolase
MKGGKAMKICADLHLHTVASGHAYGTVTEMAVMAGEKDLEIIAITDHGPAMPGAAHRFYFSNLVVLPTSIAGVEVLRGIEANIVSTSGDLDLDRRYLDRLDWVAAGLHADCLEPSSILDNTRAVVNTIESGLVDVIVHPGNPRFPLDYEAFIRAVAGAGIAIEVNNSSLTLPHRRGSESNCMLIARLAEQHDVPISLGSDAHSPWQVGGLDAAQRLLELCGVSPERVLNYSTERIHQYLRKRGKKRYTTGMPTV